MSSSRHILFANMIGFKTGYMSFTYLGVPVFMGRPKTAYILPVADKVKSKLATWKDNLLYIAGRVQLVKYVVQSMLMYCMRVYS